MIEFVTLRFQSLNKTVVVYGYLSGHMVQRVNLDRNMFVVPVVDLVMDTLKFEKQASSSSYREVFVFWRRVKDCISTPLLIGLCDKSGLELPPCLMRLPTELKLKILELFLARILPTWLAFVQRCGIWWLQTMAWGKEVL
ncbi:unnamed protein product [Brassica rapa subsp. trilocularis]